MDFRSEFCDGKQQRTSFAKGHATRASEILEIVLSDVHTYIHSILF